MTRLSALDRSAVIFNIQKYNMYDGPGVRTLVFFKGCPLRCQWCSNPEGQHRAPQILFKADLCTHCGDCAAVCPVGIHRMETRMERGVEREKGQLHHWVDRSVDCLGCGACEAACTSSALSVTGEEKSISQLLEVILEDKPFYDMSGGGVTLGGGEVSAQPEAARALLSACRQRGVNTAIETCGYANPRALARVAEFTDLFLFDLKHMDAGRHMALTGVRNETILANLETLIQQGHQVRVRMPLLKGVNDSEDEIRAILAFVSRFRHHDNFQGIDLLPYHRLGVHKYQQLGMDYPIQGDPSLKAEDLDRIETWIRDLGIPVAVVRH